MDEIVKLVSQRAGISEEQARTAVQVVASQLEKRLPAPIASQVGAYLAGGGGGGAAGKLGDLAKGAGGLFGK